MKHLNFRILLFTACLLVASLATYAADVDLITQQVTITLNAAGTLPNKIDDTKKNKITNLKIVGEINGTDLRLIRTMACDGKLSILDLEESQIVSEGYHYYYTDGFRNYYTANNEIGAFTFAWCNLTSVILPSSVTTIEHDAFRCCSSLTSVTIPNSVTSIGYSAFSNCDSLMSVTIPNSVTSIENFTFEYCSNLTSITIPNSVTSIGYGAFEGCSNLISVTIPNSVTSIGNCAFCDCSSLTSITIPNSVTSIGEYAFACSLKSVTIPSSVTNIGENAIGYTAKAIWLGNTPPSGHEKNHAKINYVANDNYSFGIEKRIYPYLSSMFEVEGVKYVPISLSERTCDAIDCAYDETATNININETVKYKGVEMKVLNINSYCFYANNFIKTAKIDNDTCDIGESAFYGCENLQGISIPDQVKSIEENTFGGCSSLAYVTIGSGVTQIWAWAFRDCSSLTSITIPKNVKEIDMGVFKGCTSLANVNIADRDTELFLSYGYSTKPLFCDCPLKKVYIGGNITYMTTERYGYSPFYGNTSLESVTITDKETEISENEFYGCINLKEVTIGDGIEKIGNYAFSGCLALETFSFGTSLKSIGNEAFSDCTSMTTLIAKTQVPPTCEDQALDDINKWNCTLYVPEGQIDAYKAAAQWKEFFFVEATDIASPTMGSNVTEVARYNIDGKRLTTPKIGINVIRMSDGTTKKVLVK